VGNIGSSVVGISVVSSLPTRNGQVNHAIIGAHVTATNRELAQHAYRALSPWTAAGRAALDAIIQNQSAIIIYIDDFKLMMILTLASVPLLLLLRGAPAADPGEHAMVME
jgi:MFS transporter, DHA2 family, multidrug resistance protein